MMNVYRSALHHVRLAKRSISGVVDGFEGAVGNTPLIRLRSLSKETGCEILGKAEFMNPGGSVKDRAALYIINDAEQRGLLRPGGTVTEGTAGNTGIGLAHICLARGYKCVIYMPNNQSQEKMDLLRALGAEVYPVPVVPYTDPNNFNHQARRHAEQLDNAFYADQFDNTANRHGHYLSTGPEIWRQTDGALDAFTCATGTGGTFAGVSTYLKEQSEHVQTILADPMGSVLYSYVKCGALDREGGSITEGIGQGRVTKNLEGAPMDDALRIDDRTVIQTVFNLLHNDGIYLGASSCLNVAAAVEVAKKLGPGKRIVTVLCDSANRYQSRLFNAKWLEEKDLLSAVPEQYRNSLA